MIFVTDGCVELVVEVVVTVEPVEVAVFVCVVVGLFLSVE
jgi:hypothetical protein